MNNKNIENTVEEVKNVFAEYFDVIGGKKFKQFYYDWHIDNMLSPFVGLVDYFNEQYGAKGQLKFHEFTNDMVKQIKIYNADKPQLSVLKNAEFSRDNNGELSTLIDGVETFGFELRQFMYNFADKKDHDNAFHGWQIKPNMPYSALYGMMLASDVLKCLDYNYTEIVSGKDVKKNALFVADSFIRRKMAPSYQYQGTYSFQNRLAFVRKMKELRNTLSDEYQTEKLSPQMKNMFQQEEKGYIKSTDREYWPSGFELEFYVPEEYKDYSKLIEHLKQHNQWHKIYTSNKDSSVYQDQQAAGVIMRDESLVRYDKLAAVEYASRVMRSKDDETECLKILDSFDEGHVNPHCSLHQHLCADGFDLETYKRLVKRTMQHEEKVVGAFAAPERRDNKLLYATYIGRNLSSNNHRDYPFMCVLTDMCEDKTQLREFASFGHKYKTLNIMPEHTVEIRFMNANFNKKFVSGFLQFNREFVKSAVENNPQHVNKILMNKYSWDNNKKTDTKTVMHKLPYAYQYHYDAFRPQKQQVTKSVIENEQKYWLLIMHALNETGKMPYLNAAFNKKVQEAKRYDR